MELDYNDLKFSKHKGGHKNYGREPSSKKSGV